MILASLPPSYDSFILSFVLSDDGKTTLSQLHGLLKQAEISMKQSHGLKESAVAPQVQVNAIGHGKGKKRKAPAQPMRTGKAPTKFSGSR